MKRNSADTWFSRYIRLRHVNEDGNVSCVTCGNISQPKNMDCGHYVKRHHQSTRYNEENCHVQCRKCNWLQQGNDVKFREYLVERYGEDRVLLLEASKRVSVKRSKRELSMIAIYYKAKTNELLTQKGIEKWW